MISLYKLTYCLFGILALAYIKGVTISHSLSLTYTSKDSCLDEDSSAAPDACASAFPLPSTVNEITLEVSGGTAKSFTVELDPTRHMLSKHESWEA